MKMNNIDRTQIRKKIIRRAVQKTLCLLVAAAMLMAVPIMATAESSTSTTGTPTTENAQTHHVTDTHSAPMAPAYKAKAKADGRSHIKVSWSKVKDVSGYSVYRSTKSTKLGKKVYTAKKAAKKSWKDNNAAVDKTYYYTVKAWSKTDGKKKTVATIKTKKVKNALKYKDSFDAKTFAYSGGGTTASGKKARVGLVAVDPNVIKLGTWLYVEGYGLCQAADTGGAIKGKKIDLYMDSVAECYQWGVQEKQVYVLE
jgi:3D (Asp-Asp-Asp) domain-containing protein